MPSLTAIALLLAGVALVVVGADAFFRGLLALAARLRLPAFIVTVVRLRAREPRRRDRGQREGSTRGCRRDLPRRHHLPRRRPRSGRSLLAADPAETSSRSRLVLLLVAGLGVLTLGGELVGEGIRKTVSHFGISATLLGNTAVAASIEAEELARVALPAKRGRSDVALANVLGTVVHFIAFNAGVIALVRPLSIDAATRHLHLPAALVATIALCTLLATRGGLGRAEGAALLALYAAYLAVALTGLGT
jgi:Ca2+/Na+ antiporter